MSLSNVEIGLYLAGEWVDVAGPSYGAYVRDPIRITTGRANWGGTVDPGQASFTLDSRSHNWAPDDVRSSFWRSYARNTPCRIGVGYGDPYLECNGGITAAPASTPNAAALSFSTAHDIRIEFTLDVDILASGTRALASKGNAGFTDGWALTLVKFGTGGILLAWDWVDAGGTRHSVTSAALPYWVSYRRMALRVTFDPTTGTTTFYYATTIGGPWNQIGSPVVTGATSLKTNTDALCLGGDPSSPGDYDGLRGKVHAFELRNGIGGTLVANPDMSDQTVGASSFGDGVGNTWTVGSTGRLTNMRWRFHGELASLPVRSDLRGTDIYAPVQASGILRRLRQGQPPLESALRRAITRSASSLIGYWPCEEQGDRLTAFGAAVGSLPMTITGGYPSNGQNTDFDCSAALPTPGAGTWIAVPDQVTTTEFQVRWLISIPAGATGSDYNVVDVGTSGTHSWYVHWRDTSGGQLKLIAVRNSVGITEYDSGWLSFNATGTPLRVTLAVREVAGSLEYDLYATDLDGNTTGLTAVAIILGTIGAVNVIRVNASGGMTSTAFGHVSLQTTNTAYSELLTELNAYDGELAGNRILRLCAEEGIAVRLVGDPDDTEAMGPQIAGTLVELLQQCADVDLGIFGEARESLGLYYRCRSDMTGQSPALTLNYAGDQVAGTIELDRDDQGFVNDWTVKGPTGATGRAQLDDGSRISVSEPPTGAGRYASSASVQATESRLLDLATTRLRFTAVDEPRVSNVGSQLHVPAMISLREAASTVRMGDLLKIDNVANYTGDLLQIIQGTRETITETQHTIGYLTTAGRPWGTGILEDATYPARADTGSSHLLASAVAGATSLLVSSVSSPLWTTDSGDFPFDIDIDGVRVTVTNITGATSPQTFTVSAVSRALAADARVQLADPTYWEL